MSGKIAFVGTGLIGSGLAVNAASKGRSVMLYDIVDVKLMQENVKKVFSILVEAGALTKADADKAYAKISYTNSLEEAVTGAEFIQECVPERLGLKKETYRKIQSIIADKAVIASSTTALLPSVLQEGALYPETILVCHPYNPAYLLPLIEICGGKQTSEESIKKAMEFYKSIGKVPVHCKKEVRGFIVNAISWAVRDGAVKAVKDGICSVEDVDKAIMFGPGMRMGVTGQLLTLGLGVDGGYRNAGRKYNENISAEEQADYDMIGDGIDEEMANRPKELGNTPEEIVKFRDKMFVQMLKMQGLL